MGHAPGGRESGRISVTVGGPLTAASGAPRDAAIWIVSRWRVSSGSDWPDRLDTLAADRVNPIVQVHGRIAVRYQELQAVAESRQLRPLGRGDRAELVAGPAVCQPLPTLRLGAIRHIGGKSLRAR